MPDNSSTESGQVCANDIGLQEVINLVPPQEQDDDDARMRGIWNDHMKNAAKAVRYLRTVVLLLSWAETDLKTKPEVDRLEEVFKGVYNYTVHKVSLNKDKRPQAQMNKYLAEFIYNYEAKGVLLIIYYAGHGWAPGGSSDEFFLLRNTDQAAQSNRKRNMVAWLAAETHLTDTEADVLVIFDCCHAGHLCDFRAPVRFEYLGACAAGQTTAAPGDTSFTQALIWALEKLSRKDMFPVSELQKEIREAPNFPKSQRPKLAHRVTPSPDHIVLAPMDNSTSCPDETTPLPAEFNYQPKECIELRLHFPVPLNDDVVIETAEAMTFLISEKRIAADSVTFIRKLTESSRPKLLEVVELLLERNSLSRRTKTVSEIARNWLKAVKQKRSEHPEPAPSENSALESDGKADSHRQTSNDEVEVRTAEILQKPAARRRKRRRSHTGEDDLDDEPNSISGMDG